MKTIKLSILGDYWDVIINDDMLYLYLMDNSIIRHDIKALYHQFAENDINSMQAEELFINNSELSSWKRFESPFKILAVDIATCKKSIYTLNDDGFFRFKNLNEETNCREFKFEKIWDQSLFSLSVKPNGRIALCGGEYGLFEYDVDQKFRKTNESFFKEVEPGKGIFSILEDHSLFSSWAYSSIMNSSIGSGSSLVVFSWLSANELFFQKTFKVSEIFGDTSENAVYWGAFDTIFRATNDRSVQYVDFRQSAVEKGKNPFSPIHTIDLLEVKGRPIFAGGNQILNVIECENALVLFTKDRRHVFNILEPVTRWRLFPGVNLYQTIATVVLDNQVDIYFFSFSQDEYITNPLFGKITRKD